MENLPSSNDTDYIPELPLDRTNLSSHFEYMRQLQALSPEYNQAALKLFHYIELQLSGLDEYPLHEPNAEPISIYDREVSNPQQVGEVIITAARHAWDVANETGQGIYSAKGELRRGRDVTVMQTFDRLFDHLLDKAIEYSITPEEWLRGIFGPSETTGEQA